jgi:hypothetical protein
LSSPETCNFAKTLFVEACATPPCTVLQL